MQDFTEGFYLSAFTIFMGGLALIVRFAYKSKCKEVTCGCIKIVRDTDVEEREDTQEIRHENTTPSLNSTF